MGLYVEIEKSMGDFRLEVQFEVERESLALLGASGCGKSVTLQCVAGILTPDRGRITLDGITLFDSAANIDLPPQKRRVGYLFQQYALFPNMMVRQNIAAAVRDRKTRAAAAEEKLRQFRLEAVADQRPGELSGGQQQRCALARILASEPEVILLDEPFSALDSYLKCQLELELWETLSVFSGPVVWVSHDRGEVLRNCHRVCVLDQGKSQAVQSMADLMARPGSEVAARLSGCENFTDALPESGGLYLPEWNVHLSCSVPIPENVRRVGIRARNLHLAEVWEENVVSCSVVRVVEDMDALLVLLRPARTVDVPLIRMKADKESWRAGAGSTITVAVEPGEILLFTDK